MKIITFFFKMLVGDFMIDDTNYADCLALYNFNHVDKIKGKESIIPHKCHSKLCTSCSSKEAKLRAAHIFSIALDAKHRHIVFTIPKHLRGCFTKDRSLLNLLFIAAINTFACVFNDAKYRKIKKKKTMMTITLMIASTTLTDTLPNLPWLKTASSNMKMTKR